MKPLLADFDLDQLTCVEWSAIRLQHAVEPDIDARAFKSLKKLRKSEERAGIVVVDTRGLADELAQEVAEDSDVVFLPTGVSGDDLRPTLALARKLAKNGAEGRVVIVLSKIGRSEVQLQKAIETIEESGFELLVRALAAARRLSGRSRYGPRRPRIAQPLSARGRGEDGEGLVRPRAEREAALTMAARSGSADLPLHGGRVPRWLGERMTKLGAVIAEAIVHRIRPRRVPGAARASLLVPVLRRRDGHGLAFLGNHHLRARRAEARPRPRARANSASMSAAAAARIRARRRTSLVAIGGQVGFDGARARRREPPRRQGRQRRGAGRLRSLSARLHRRRRRQMGGRAAGHERRFAAGAALPLALGGSTSFVDAPHAAIDGPEQGVIVNLTDRRADASRRRQIDVLADLGPDGVARALGEATPRG